MLEETSRGFGIVNFTDSDNEACKLQESSIATDDCLWLGPTGPNFARIHGNMDIFAPIENLMLHFLDAVDGKTRGRAGIISFMDTNRQQCAVQYNLNASPTLSIAVEADPMSGNGTWVINVDAETIRTLVPYIHEFNVTGLLGELPQSVPADSAVVASENASEPTSDTPEATPVQ